MREASSKDENQEVTTHLVTFSDESMSRARELCALSARHHGVNDIHEYGPSGVASAFIGHEAIWNNPKGCGLWSWKPMILNQIMGEHAFIQNVRDDDVIIYSDAGVEFINNVNYIIDRMDQDIFLFGNNWQHAHWCKADVIHAVMPEWAELRIPFKQADGSYIKSLSMWGPFGKQVQASVIFFRVSDYSRKFVAEWLKWCLFEGGRLIDDSPSRAPNHPEFREHRHDQSILTTLAYREGISIHYWPAVYNKGGSPEFVYEKLPEYAGDDYPILFSHNRKRNYEW